MFLLQLPIWSYVVVSAIAIAGIGALPHWVTTRRSSRENRLNQRRARAAASLLRVLNDEQVKRAVGIRSH
jgi:hypothetical protein